jgi:hypothetical protein
VSSFPIERRLFITGLAASVLAACSGRGTSLIPAKATSLPNAPGGVNPGSIKVPDMVRTPIQPASAMTGRRPQIPTNIPLSWQIIPGSASRIAASPDGSIWALSDQPAGPDKYIWHYSTGTWTNVTGMATEIAVDGAGVLYVINNAGGVYRYNAGTQDWTSFGGGASSIAVSLDTTDNPIYVISNSGPGPDYAIYRYQANASGWVPFLGGGVRLAGSIDPTGNYEGGNVNPFGVYLVNAAGNIYYMQNDNAFFEQTGAATQIAPAIAGYFALQYPAAGNNDNAIYYYDYGQGQYTQQQGSAFRIAFNKSALFAVSYTGAIYMSPVVIPVPLTLDASQANLPAGTAVYAYVVGGISTNGGVSLAAAYRLDSTGMPTPISTSDNTIASGTFPDPLNTVSAGDTSALAATYPQSWADYSIPLSLSAPTVIDLSKINPTNCPGLGVGTAAFSGRIYISIGVPKLPFSPTSSSGFTQPGYLSTNAGAMLLWDDMEFSYDSSGNFNCNPTQVNGIGLVLTIAGQPGGSLQGKYNVARDVLISSIETANSAAYGTLTQPNTTPSAFPSGVTSLRIQSPGQLILTSGYSGGLLTSFDTTLSTWYTTWATQSLTITDTATGTWVGSVSSTGVLFTYQGGATTTPSYSTWTYSGTGANGQLSSEDIWKCASTGDSYQQNIQKIILAAFNRGVVSNTMNDGACPDSSTFYPTAAGAQPSNQYSNSVHQASVNKMAYGFAYDDVCGANPSISLSPASSVTITLRPLTGSA